MQRLKTQLYKELIYKLQLLGINSVIGGISLPNPASVALHEKVGMKKVAHFPNVGFKFGKWLDVGYWQLHLRN
jgi:L-amino acid N-acyltransferase YncA